MHNTIQSDSYSESVKRGVYEIATKPVTLYAQAAAIDNSHQRSISNSPFL